MTFEPSIAAYLKTLTGRVRRALGDDLSGLYLCGSMTNGDFEANRSDIDVLAVAARPLGTDQKEGLARELPHSQLACPAVGLELVVVTASVAATGALTVPYEFALTTGETWDLEVELEGTSTELLLDLAVCRDSGYPLVGPPPGEVFAAVLPERLIVVLLGTIRWHRRQLFHSFHDPLGAYAVLNACRAWHYSAEGILGSKTGGGTWALARRPTCSVIAEALAIRRGEREERLDRALVEGVLDEVEKVLVDRL